MVHLYKQMFQNIGTTQATADCSLLRVRYVTMSVKNGHITVSRYSVLLRARGGAWKVLAISLGAGPRVRRGGDKEIGSGAWIITSGHSAPQLARTR